MRSSNEDSDRSFRKSKKSFKRLRTNSRKVSEDSQKSRNFHSKKTIKEFEKLLITQQENRHKSQKNFFGSKEVKSGNR